MVTTTAMVVMFYSGAVALTGAVLLFIARHRPRLRGMGLRLITLFGVTALASFYIWVDLGPSVDAQLTSDPRPAIPAAPRTMDV
jgi:hypothetical protein